jgi:spore maturation protein CgeB
VIAYKSTQDCAELLTYYLEHEEERAAIACAGQKRTLREHTYRRRMEEFVAIIEKYL